MDSRHIIFGKNGKRLIKFDSIKSKHFVASSDFGSFRTEEVANNGNMFRRLLEFYFSSESYVFIKPEHSDRILTPSYTDTGFHECDAILDFGYSGGGKVICAITGDCPYIFLESVDGSFAGLVHSGWRSTLKNIAGKAVTQILKKGARTEMIRIGLLSGICKGCYEVGKDVYSLFEGKYKEFFSPYGKKWKMDLSGIILRQLREAGIESIIEIVKICPLCSKDGNDSPLLFSARRGQTERNLLCIKK